MGNKGMILPRTCKGQRTMFCSCGRERVMALGVCAICYTLRRQDQALFDGLRELVLERDGYACRVCGASGRRKWSIAVHHRVPGRSVLHLMISLCLGCHARVHRTKAVLSEMPPLLLQLWREQHPRGHEQRILDFKFDPPLPRNVSLFAEVPLAQVEGKLNASNPNPLDLVERNLIIPPVL